MSQTTCRREEGFTLIELLVVIAIIAILAGILFPVFSSARKTAQRTACLSNIKQLAQCFEMYKGDYGGFFPLGGFKFATSDYSLEWQNACYRYAKTEQIFRCPASPAPLPDPAQPGSLGPDSRNPRTPITYLYNVYLGAEKSSASAAQLTPKSQRESSVARPAACILLIEGNPGFVPTGAGVDGAGRTKTLWLRDYTFAQSASVITGGDGANKSFGLPHHRDGGNVAFVDGHAGYFKYRDSRSLQAVLPWMRHVPKESDTVVSDVDSNPWKP
jgi:prepilin-type N-terminal cleavage/methylation domain-containing protein/prepilin-type processing-associated H-X9-DG protein